MKATFDLPPELIRELKLRAVNEGRKLRELAAELLQRGLAAPSPSPWTAKPRVEIQANGMPLIHGHAKAPARRISTAELLALEQATLHEEDRKRLGHSL